ncbi:hypothetical protein BLOT_015398 [Blomia tropicalis]|nr:hypothetical protein BLOT_015398 [Blomia tropicalis]
MFKSMSSNLLALTYWISPEMIERKNFIFKVYTLLAIGLVITFSNSAIAILFISQVVPAYQSVFNRDFTVHKLTIWTANLIWLIMFILLWIFDCQIDIVILWTTLGLVVILLIRLISQHQTITQGFAVETQMVIGPKDCKYMYSESQYMLASISLYWYSLLLFAMLLPIINLVVGALTDINVVYEF